MKAASRVSGLGILKPNMSRVVILKRPLNTPLPFANHVALAIRKDDGTVRFFEYGPESFFEKGNSSVNNVPEDIQKFEIHSFADIPNAEDPIEIAKKYAEEFNKNYNAVSNNCQDFVNGLSKILNTPLYYNQLENLLPLGELPEQIFETDFTPEQQEEYKKEIQDWFKDYSVGSV